eukprot:TRINITY_DN465_c0_g2_i1.p1 TRINITY_DN465_c0_g2~~TRINITY_DN465_c0_g2_i1.p1  ORF type:complete len:633 (-),score=89.32 TRINITY_DN465_c0_g2_i1:151-2049(-)
MDTTRRTFRAPLSSSRIPLYQELKKKIISIGTLKEFSRSKSNNEEKGDNSVVEQFNDGYVFAAVLKSYLGSMSEPLFTFPSFSFLSFVFDKESKEFSVEAKIEAIQSALAILPPLNRYMMNRLFFLLQEMKAKGDINKTTVTQISNVFRLYIFRPKPESRKKWTYEEDSILPVSFSITSFMLENYTAIFKMTPVKWKKYSRNKFSAEREIRAFNELSTVEKKNQLFTAFAFGLAKQLIEEQKRILNAVVVDDETEKKGKIGDARNRATNDIKSSSAVLLPQIQVGSLNPTFSLLYPSSLDEANKQNEDKIDISEKWSLGDMVLNAEPEVEKLAECLLEGKMTEAQEEILNSLFKDGSSFEGDLDSYGNFHGFGRLIYSNGNIYEGEFNHGFRHGNGSIYFTNGDSYIGQFHQNQRHGLGVYRFAKTGCLYSGEYMEGKRHGRGIFEFQQHPRHRHDQKNHQGEESAHPDENDDLNEYPGLDITEGDLGNQKNVYEGEFQNGKAHGYGKLTFSTGDVYLGFFHSNHIHGTGVFIDRFGNRYEGEYKYGKRSGRGKFLAVSGAIYEGDFLDGVMEGKGIYIFPSNDKYEGDFMDGEFHGYGIYSFTEGRKLEGLFKNGKPQIALQNNSETSTGS